MTILTNIPDPKTWTGELTFASVIKGEKGDPGEQGPPGIQGEPGPQGEAGDVGEPGAVYKPVPTQLAQDKVSIKWTNTQGLPNPSEVTLTAPRGIQGDTGQQGEPGIQGPKGDPGVKGANGITFTPKSTQTALNVVNLQWTNDGGVDNPQPVTLVAPSGAAGTPGIDGDTPEIKSGYWWLSGVNTGVKAEGKDGKGIVSATVTNHHLMITYTDGTTVDAGEVHDNNYNTLDNKPSISGNTLAGDVSLTDIGVTQVLSDHNVSTTAHQDIRNAIPTKTSDIVNDSGFINKDVLGLTHYSTTDETKEQIDTSIAGKVDKVVGKQLSTLDFDLRNAVILSASYRRITVFEAGEEVHLGKTYTVYELMPPRALNPQESIRWGDIIVNDQWSLDLFLTTSDTNKNDLIAFRFKDDGDENYSYLFSDNNMFISFSNTNDDPQLGQRLIKAGDIPIGILTAQLFYSRGIRSFMLTIHPRFANEAETAQGTSYSTMVSPKTLRKEITKRIPDEPTSGKVLISDGTNNNKWVDFEEQFLSYYAYGVERDMALPATSYRRIGNMQLHRELPIHEKLRRCILKDDGTVNYYLSGEKTQGNLYKGDETWNAGNSIFTKTGDVIRGQANTTTASTPYIRVFLQGAVVADKDYSISFYGRADKATTARTVKFRRAISQEYLGANISYTTEWRRFEYTFNSTSDVSGERELTFTVGAGGAAGNVTDWIELRDIKLEQLPMKEDGTTAKLDGTDGQYMVEIPKGIYMRYDTIPNSTKYRVWCSEHALPGFHLATPTPLYVSAVEATTDKTLGTTSALAKLASVCNMTEAFRGIALSTTPAWDNTYRTVLGRPASANNIITYRTIVRNRSTAGRSGVGWNIYTYEIHKLLYWLYTIEYANTNCQLPFIEERDANGFKQGGLGSGVTTLNNTAWMTFNNSFPFIPCGHTNSLGNQTGTVPFTMPVEYNNGVPHTVDVPSYRGIENWFGHISKLTDGAKIKNQSTEDGGLSEFYTTEDPAHFSEAGFNTFKKKGNSTRIGGNIKNILFGKDGDIISTSVEGGNSIYFCDTVLIAPPSTGTTENIFMTSGVASEVGFAGIGWNRNTNTTSTTSASTGTRLTFYPELPE